jgi:hypothetical protein
MKRLLLIWFMLISFVSFTQTTLFSETFETGNSLTLVNGTQTNKWFRGTANQCDGTGALYISNNSSAYAYTITSISVVHAYFDIVVPASVTNITLNFNRKVVGESTCSTCDYLQIWSCINTFTPTAGTLVTANANRVLQGTISNSAICTTTSYTLPNAIAGTTRRIIFSWRNDGSAGTIPALIDNITVTYTNPTAPTCASLSAPSNGATDRPLNQVISWAATATATGYDVYFGTSATPPLVSSNQAGTTYTPTLAGGTTYYFKIVPKNGVGDASGCNTWSFTTASPPSNDACSGATSLPCATSALAGTTVNAVSETAPNSSTTGTMGVWYKFTGDGSTTTLTVVQGFDTRLLVLTSNTGACGGTYTTVANVDNITSSNEVATFTATSGTVYFVYIGHYNSTTTGTFTISRTCVTPPSNNNCSSAPALTINSGSSCSSSTNGTTVGANQSVAACVGTADDDVWYSFVANGTSQTLTVTPGTLSDAVLQVYSGTCAGLTSLACVDNTSGSSTETTTVTGLTNGVTYYVRVHSYGNGTGQGTFSICATTPCSTSTNPGTISANVTTTTVNDGIVFTTTGNEGTINRIEWSSDNFTTVDGFQTNPANPFSLFLNVQLSTIWVRTRSVNGTCPASFNTPVSVTLNLAPEYIYGTSSGDYISNVTLNTINNNSTYDAPQGYDSYQNFTSILTTLNRGTTYTISASSPMTYSNYSGYVAWIDFDNDGVFETTETIMQQAPGATRSQSFTVPPTTNIGTVTLRILSSWAETPSNDAYYSLGYDWGEIEEYRINITFGLPVELSVFDGVNKGNNNHLFWVTSSEQNTSHFNLQKSRDGETWTTITTLNAAGNSTNQIDYNVTDYKVEPIINYYRLQQYDLNGVYETYGPIAINNMDSETEKTIVKYINLRGQEVDPSQFTSTGIYIEVYSDGTMKKVYR